MKYSCTRKILGNVLVAILSPLFYLIVKSPKVFNTMRTGFYREGYRGYFIIDIWVEKPLKKKTS